MGTAQSHQRPNPSPYENPRAPDSHEKYLIQLTKEGYPALHDDHFEWMKRTKGALVLTGKDQAEVESVDATVDKFVTEEKLQDFIKGRVWRNTVIFRWYDIYGNHQSDRLLQGCEDFSPSPTGCHRVVYPITVSTQGRTLNLRCIVDTGSPISYFYDREGAGDTTGLWETETIVGQVFQTQRRRFRVKINATEIPRNLIIKAIDKQVQGYDGIIGQDLLQFCHMTVYRKKCLLVVTEHAH